MLDVRATIATVALAVVLAGCDTVEERADAPRADANAAAGPSALGVSEDVGLNYGSIGNAGVLFSRLDQELKNWSAAQARLDAAGEIAAKRSLDALARGNFTMLGDALVGKDPHQRAIAAMALGFSGEARAVPPLEAALGDERAAVRANAAAGLGLLGIAGSGVQSLAARLEGDPDPAVRSAAGYALSLVLRPGEDHGATGALIKGTADPVPSVRAHAALALGMVKSRFAVPTLSSRCLLDAHPLVRYNAALALGHIKDPRASAALAETLARDADPGPRAAAAWALEAITGQKLGEDPVAWRAWIDAHLGDLQASPDPTGR